MRDPVSAVLPVWHMSAGPPVGGPALDAARGHDAWRALRLRFHIRHASLFSYTMAN